MYVEKGWKTSEFYLAVGSALASLLVALGFGSAEEAVRQIFAVASTVIPSVYGLLRTLTKRAVVAANAAIAVTEVEA